MKCQFCGADMPEGVEICPQCGAGVAAKKADTVVMQQDGEVFAMLKKQKRIATILTVSAIVLPILCIALLIITASTAKELPAPAFSYESSELGDYVSTDLVYVQQLYESNSVDEETGEVKSTNYYYCRAVNTAREIVLIKVKPDYYANHLKQLEANEDAYYDAAQYADEAVRVYADVAQVDDLVDTELREDFEDFDSVNIRQLTLYSGAKTESNNQVILLPIIGIASLVLLIAAAKKRKKVKRLSRLVKDYGDYLAIQKAVKSSAVFNDGKVIANKDYIMSFADNSQLVATAEVLCLYEYVHKTNFAVDDVSLMIVNQYGETMKIKYPVKAKDTMPETIKALFALCPRAVVGFSEQTKQYIAQNKKQRQN